MSADDKKFWEVDLWFKSTFWGGTCPTQTGGHFGYTAGETWREVLDQVIKLRNAPDAELTSVRITLRERDY